MSKWIVRPRPRPQARMRIFCFPYAGGGAGIYRPWMNAVSESIELCAVQPPGREERIGEAPLTNWDTVVAEASAAVASQLDLPYAIFGHSLGAIVGFEVARVLEAQGRPRPSVLFTSGRRAPTVPWGKKAVSGLPQDEFLAEIGRMNGADPAFEEFAKHPELVELLMPVLRADFALAETYARRPGPGLHCPIVALSSHDDRYAQEDVLQPWSDETSASFQTHFFPGGHLYLNEHRAALVDYVVRELGQRAAELPPDRESAIT